MNVAEKIAALVKLGGYVDFLIQNGHNPLYQKASEQNPWFIPPFLKSSLSGISRYLQKDTLEKWIKGYPIAKHQRKNIGLILAGNIPLVGFHDLLCVLISGHKAHLKLSHQDEILMTALTEKLLEIESRFKDQIRKVSNLTEVDAIIATGSDNSARYFYSTCRNLPHLIRKNRTSIAVLDGNESEEELIGLADDIFLYFGMGCRNVSKIYVPGTYDLGSLCLKLKSKQRIIDHSKYHHNYVYQKSLSRITNMRFYDGGYYILEESEKLVSPISVVYYSRYKDLDSLSASLLFHQEKIQTIVSRIPKYKNAVPFGKAQYPELWDYADQVDTLDFLLNL